MEAENFLTEIVDWLKQQGQSQADIDKVLEGVRKYDARTNLDSLMESYSKGDMTLDAIIAEAIEHADDE